MDEMINKDDILKELQKNFAGECDAIGLYNEFIKHINASDFSEEQKERVIPEIKEIISDEMNHQVKLHAIYTVLSGIETNKD